MITILFLFSSRKTGNGTIEQRVENTFARNVSCFYNAHEHTFGIQVTTKNIINEDLVILSRSYVSPNFLVKLKTWVTSTVYTALVTEEEIETLVEAWRSTKGEQERVLKNKVQHTYIHKRNRTKSDA